MTNLRNKLIRLAHEKPELRSHLLPILKESARALRKGDKVVHVDDPRGDVGVIVSMDGRWPHGDAEVRWSDGEVISHPMDVLELKRR